MENLAKMFQYTPFPDALKNELSEAGIGKDINLIATGQHQEVKHDKLSCHLLKVLNKLDGSLRLSLKIFMSKIY